MTTMASSTPPKQPARPENPETNVFVRELHEEIQRDKAMRWVKRFQAPLVTLAVLLIVGVGGYEAYKGLRHRGEAQESARYGEALTLLADNKRVEAVAVLTALVDGGRYGVSKLAGLSLADVLAQGDDAARAREILEKLAADSAAPKAVRQSAGLRLAAMDIREDRTDAALERLKGLTGANDVFPHSAREFAVDALLRQGRREEALKELEILSAVNQPNSLRKRAAEVEVHVRRAAQ